VGEGAIRHEESARRPVLVSNVIDLAKYDLAIDAHTFVRAETQERAWTPATTFDGRKLPYGWAGSFNPMKGRGWSIASGGYRYDTEKASHELLTRWLDDRRRAAPQ